MLTKCTRVCVEYLRVHVHYPRAEVLHLLVRMCESRVACAYIASGSTIHVRTGLACTCTPTRTCACTLVRYSHSRTRTCTVLASAALISHELSLHPRVLSASVKLLVICTVATNLDESGKIVIHFPVGWLDTNWAESGIIVTHILVLGECQACHLWQTSDTVQFMACFWLFKMCNFWL